jgi:hypothetical protein
MLVLQNFVTQCSLQTAADDAHEISLQAEAGYKDKNLRNLRRIIIKTQKNCQSTTLTKTPA